MPNIKNQDESQAHNAVNQAVAEGGAYEVIRQRLLDQGKHLQSLVCQLNDARLQEFGSSEMQVQTRANIRTANNCVARDIVQVGKRLLFGYNVFIGLKKETRVEDVFALFEYDDSAKELSPTEIEGSFLADTRFSQDFRELYTYYKHTRLTELTIKDGKLLMGFQIGERIEDIRVFRWALSADGQSVTYIDNRGERDIQLPNPFDFEWIETTREDTVHGRFAHVNIGDRVFVETTGGDLTVKVENNTEEGEGIYSEPVEDATQSIDDAAIFYAFIGDLVLLKILPYKEVSYRYFVFNTLNQNIERIDGIGASCVQLPEDHGIIFPGGCYLQSGEKKLFDNEGACLRFKRKVLSPNGEDVLYVFFEQEQGVVGLFAYNMIEKSLLNPIYAHGYALSDEGYLVIFSAEGEPTRVHPMQVWKTPFCSDEFASTQDLSQSELGKIGNPTLVRGISDLMSICRAVSNQDASSRTYEDLSRSARKIFDEHYWIDTSYKGDLAIGLIVEELNNIAKTSDLAIDEFLKVESIRQSSEQALKSAKTRFDEIAQNVRTASWESIEGYVSGLDSIRVHKGHLATIKEYRYINTDRITSMEAELTKLGDDLSVRTVHFLSDDQALEPYAIKIGEFKNEIEEVTSNAELAPLIESIDKSAQALDLLSDLLSTLKIEDANQRTQIVDSISEIYSKLNQCRANARHRKSSFGEKEAIAQFSAQFKLLSQSVANGISLANTPESCDEQLSRLLVQLEEIEGQFSDYDQFIGDIVAKREEIYESFENQKQRLLDERESRAQAINDAAVRVLDSISRRSNSFTDQSKLNTYFASDPMVTKVVEFIATLREFNAMVKADDIEAKLKAVKEQAIKAVRDKVDIYQEGGSVIKLGPRHRFSVNSQELDLTLIPRGEQLYFHLTGTDFFQPIPKDALPGAERYWGVSFESESAQVYRAEYLASSIIYAAERNLDALSWARLDEALLDSDDLLNLVREFAAPRYKEGYEKGIHDFDAAEILKKLIPAMKSVDLLIYDPMCRGVAQVFWANIEKITEQLETRRLTYKTWQERARSAAEMQSLFLSSEAQQLLGAEIYLAMQEFVRLHPLPCEDMDLRRAADYLVHELGRDRTEFIGSKYAKQLAQKLRHSLDEDAWRRFQLALEKMLGWPAERWSLSCAWLEALVVKQELNQLRRYVPEAAALINADERIDRRETEADLELKVGGLMGQHAKVHERCLAFSVDSFFQLLDRHRSEFIPAYHQYLEQRQTLIDSERSGMRLQEFKPRPLSSFVRNRLINEVYLPIIGDNLAKQMGTVGSEKRTDLMGLLMMISPPGYGKTTLMEYVANRLGLIFMKINCPSLGHDVLSLDPIQAPNATAKQELHKLNLALEMGSNVMLYLDDIQHTHPEFLQKFISLCDGTRRIEGVWNGATRTYDMRGKKFCVVMAGNPYTESGEAFRVPDMLANRADIYNLGDILGGKDEQFEMSYIENCLTSNPVLAPLAVRDIEDVYLLIRMANGEAVATSELKHAYSGAEVGEIVEVLKKLFVIRDVILKVNKEYILSAAKDDKYRTEPSFKLQGSYRNMNKMAEKVSSVMTQDELMQLVSDHYLGESQLLTKGAEENLLKLAELRGNMTEAERGRWQEIKNDFLRNKAMGGDGDDIAGRVVAQLADVATAIQSISKQVDSGFQQNTAKSGRGNEDIEKISLLVEKATKTLAKALNKPSAPPSVEVVNQPVPGIDALLKALADTIEHSIFPLVRSMEKKLDIDLRTYNKINEVSESLRSLETDINKTQG